MLVNSTLLRKIYTAGVLSVLAAAAAYLALNYNGFCWKDNDFLSQEEKKVSAVQYILDHYPPVLGFRVNYGNGERSFYARPKEFVRYQSVEEFFSLNPNCCLVVDKGYKGFEPSLTSRLSGSISSLVKVDFDVHYLGDKERVLSRKHTMYLAISNCGHAWSGI